METREPLPYDHKGYLGQYADLMVPTKNPARLHHHALGRVIIRLLGPSEKLTNRQLNLELRVSLNGLALIRRN